MHYGHDESDKNADLRSTKTRLAEAWQSTLGKFATADEGSKRLVKRLVEWGKLTTEEGRSLLNDWRTAVEENRSRLEQRVEQSVQASMRRFQIPSLEELRSLLAQVQELERRVGAHVRENNHDEKTEE